MGAGDQQGKDEQNEGRKGKDEERGARYGDIKNDFSGRAKNVIQAGIVNVTLAVKSRNRARRFGAGLIVCLVVEFMLGDVYAQIFKGHRHLNGGDWGKLVLMSFLTFVMAAIIYIAGKGRDPFRSFAFLPGFSAIFLIPTGYHIGPTDLAFLDPISHFLGSFLLWGH